MIPPPPPPMWPRRQVSVNCEFVPVSAEFAARLRSGGRWVGGLSIFVVVVALLGLLAGGVMLTFTVGLGGGLAAILGAAGAGLALASAIGVLASANYVSAGYLNVTFARRTRWNLLLVALMTVVQAVASSLPLVASASQEGVLPPAAGVCLVLVWMNCVVSAVDAIIGRKLLNWGIRR